MQQHVNVMFVYDDRLRMTMANEPWAEKSPAPRFFMGRSLDGSVTTRYRCDLPDDIVEAIERRLADEPVITDWMTAPEHSAELMKLLKADTFTMGPCYWIPEKLHQQPAQAGDSDRVQIVRLAAGDDIASSAIPGELNWLLEELEEVQPCIVLLYEGKAVSVCRSVRITAAAHEAGLETLEGCRGKGYAAQVTAAWAAAVRELGSIPLYSTSSDNMASQRVASKLGLLFYGVNFSIQ